MEALYQCLLGLALLELSVYSVTGQWCAPKLFETKKWTLQITHTDQGPDIWESTSTMSFDTIGQRLASTESGTHNGRDYTVFYLYYYPAGTLYTVQNGICTASPATGNVTALCFDWGGGHVIDYLTKEYIGVGDDGTPIMGAITYKDGIGSLYSFDLEGNIPLFMAKDGMVDGVPTYSVSSYLNVTFGIRDPTVFTPPEGCIKSQIPADPSLLRHSLLSW